VLVVSRQDRQRERPGSAVLFCCKSPSGTSPRLLEQLWLSECSLLSVSSALPSPRPDNTLIDHERLHPSLWWSAT
jgi:hypothetical protein